MSLNSEKSTGIPKFERRSVESCEAGLNGAQVSRSLGSGSLQMRRAFGRFRQESGPTSRRSDRVDKSIKRHVKLGLVLSSHSPPGSVTLAWVTTRPRPTLLSMDTRQPRRVRRIASQTGIRLPTPSLVDA